MARWNPLLQVRADFRFRSLPFQQVLPGTPFLVLVYGLRLEFSARIRNHLEARRAGGRPGDRIPWSRQGLWGSPQACRSFQDPEGGGLPRYVQTTHPGVLSRRAEAHSEGFVV